MRVYEVEKGRFAVRNRIKPEKSEKGGTTDIQGYGQVLDALESCLDIKIIVKDIEHRKKWKRSAFLYTWLLEFTATDSLRWYKGRCKTMASAAISL